MSMSASGSASPIPDRRPRRRRGIKNRKRDGENFSGNEEDEDLELGDSDIEEDRDTEDEEGWHASESGDDGEDDDVEVSTRALCIFCNQDEDHDPSPEYEAALECAVCGSLSHRQCARSAKEKADGGDPAALHIAFDEEASEWRCPTCEDLAVEPESTETKSVVSRRKRNSDSTTEAPVIPNRSGSNSIREDEAGSDRELLPEYRPNKKRKTADLDESDASPLSAPPKKRIIRRRRRANALNSPTPDHTMANGITGPEGDNESLAAEAVAAGEQESHTIRSSNRVNVLATPKIPKPRGRPRLKKSDVSIVVKRTSRRYMLHVTGLNPKRLASALAGEPVGAIATTNTTTSTTRPVRRRVISSNPAFMNTPVQSSSHNHRHTPNQPHTPYMHFPAGPRVDDDDSKPYGGILSDAEADTSRTLPTTNDKARFEKAKQEAEEERATRLRLSAASNLPPFNNVNGTTTTATGSVEPSDDGSSQLPEKVSGPASKIQCIHFGNFEIDTWYAAPYPEEYSKNKILYICEFCLKYMNSEYVSWRHKMKCPAKHPPGDEIYRDGSISVFEVDGRKNPVYCHYLCLLAKLFLGSKTLYYDVEPFLFYVMTEYDEFGCHFVGYFSKEKTPTSQHNVSCILTLPIHQRKGYGNLLIDFSYLLTRTERKTGSPEKPLSDLGLVSYRNYWRLVLCYVLRNQKKDMSIEDISVQTGMTPDDIICGLEALHTLVRDPVTGAYALRLDYTAYQMHIDKWEAKGYVKLNPKALVWTPFVIGRVQPQGPALTTVAPREGAATTTSTAVTPYQEKAEEKTGNMEPDAMDYSPDADQSQVGDHIEENDHNNALDTHSHEMKTERSQPGHSEMGDDITMEATTTTTTTTTTTITTTTVGATTATSSESKPFPLPSGGKPHHHVIKLGHELTSSTEPTTPPTTITPTASTSKSHRYHPADDDDDDDDNDDDDTEDLDSHSIPATRFEIYPPLPGVATNKRGGRGFGASTGGGPIAALNRIGRKRTMSPSTPRNRLIESARNSTITATAPPKLYGLQQGTAQTGTTATTRGRAGSKLTGSTSLLGGRGLGLGLGLGSPSPAGSGGGGGDTVKVNGVGRRGSPTPENTNTNVDESVPSPALVPITLLLSPF